MQPRTPDGNVFTDPDGYTYWMLADNYCYWEDANCVTKDGARSALGQAWDCTGGNCDNNYSLHKQYNVLQTLGAFYNSLSTTIAGATKSIMVKQNANWDAWAITNNGQKGSCISGWYFGSVNYSGAPFNFQAPDQCNYNGPVGLISYYEWVGGPYASNTIPNADGSGRSYCNSRYGLSCDNVDLTNSALGQPNRPWLRSGGNQAFNLYRVGSSGRLDEVNPDALAGVLPTIWLSSKICTNEGGGSYANPYTLTVCPANTPPTISIANPANNQNIATTSAITINSTITDPNDDIWTVWYKVTDNSNQPTDGWTVLCASSVNKNCVANLAAMTTAGSYYLHLRVFDGYANGYNKVAFKITAGGGSGGASPTPSPSASPSPAPGGNTVPSVAILEPSSGQQCGTNPNLSLKTLITDPDHDTWTVYYYVATAALTPTPTLSWVQLYQQTAIAESTNLINVPTGSETWYLYVRVNDGHADAYTTISCSGGTAITPSPTPAPATTLPASVPPASSNASSSASLPISGSTATLVTSFLGCVALGFGAYYQKRHQLLSPKASKGKKSPKSKHSYSDFDPYR
jgi:hypothetical protein